MTLSRLIADYLLYRRALGRRLVRDGVVLRSFCRSVGRLPLAHLRSDSVRVFLLTGAVGHETIARRHRALAGFYRYVQGRHGALLPALPRLPAGPPSSFVPYIYSREELRRLLHATTTACQHTLALVDAETLRALVLLLYGAGLRLGEALALNVADVDLNQAVLIVRQTKFYKTRLVPLSRDLTDVLIGFRSWRDRQPPSDPRAPFFCLRDGNRAHHKIVERTFRLLCVIAGVSRGGGPRRQPRLHDLRHTAAVHRLIEWYQTGSDLQQLLPRLATYLGHRNLSATQRYLTLTPPLLREASVRFQHYALESRHD
jgi:integrase/recombinase XerD